MGSGKLRTCASEIRTTSQLYSQARMAGARSSQWGESGSDISNFQEASLEASLPFSCLLPALAGWTAGGIVGAEAFTLHHETDASQSEMQSSEAEQSPCRPQSLLAAWVAYVYVIEKNSSIYLSHSFSEFSVTCSRIFWNEHTVSTARILTAIHTKDFYWSKKPKERIASFQFLPMILALFNIRKWHLSGPYLAPHQAEHTATKWRGCLLIQTGTTDKRKHNFLKIREILSSYTNQ